MLHVLCCGVAVCPCVLQLTAQMTWIERLREWLASELLQPLAHHFTTAHELPNQAIAARAPNAKVRACGDSDIDIVEISRDITVISRASLQHSWAIPCLHHCSRLYLMCGLLCVSWPAAACRTEV